MKMARQFWHGSVEVLLASLLSCLVSATGPFGEYGVVRPSDPFLFVGNTLELYCNITNAALQEDSSRLHFQRNTSTDRSIIPSDFVEVLTTKSIRLRLPKLDVSDDGTYVCLLRTLSGIEEVIGHQIVQVDYKPKAVENISCRVYNWESMKCTWDLGVKFHYPQYVNVTVAWTILVSKRSPSYGAQRDCSRLTSTSCEWTGDEYQHGHMYIMIVHVKTVVRNSVMWEAKSVTFRIETQLYVEPAPVNNFQATYENSTCIIIRWQHDSSNTRAKFFVAQYWNKLKERWMDIILRIDGKDDSPFCYRKEEDFHSLVCGLNPFTEYEFRMSVLPCPLDIDKPVSHGHMSEWKTVSAKTSSDVPGSSPSVCPGCFHEQKCLQGNSCRIVTLYWQDLDESEKHGIITRYNIAMSSVQEKFQRDLLIPVTSGTLTSADIELPFSENGFNISITPGTDKGFSQRSSSIFIPSITTKPHPPMKFLVERDKDNDGNQNKNLYVSWAALNIDPRTGSKYTNVTVVWCFGNRIDLFCETSLRWISLPSDQVTFELPTGVTDNPSDFLIGITAETLQSGHVTSSGILWATCIYLRNQKPQNPPKNVRFSSTHPFNGLMVLWDRFECPEERTFITEYLVNYCPSYDGLMCREAEKQLTLHNNITAVTIKDLKEGTKYRVYLTAVSGAGLGPPSDGIAHIVTGPPKSEETSVPAPVFIAIALALVVFFIIAVICCYKYCCSRKKRIPHPDDLIQPYAESQKYPMTKHQDFRNRPLPKTPEEQHYYGSSACMNNPGSETSTDSRSSECSSEESVTSHTNLIPNQVQDLQNSQSSPASKNSIGELCAKANMPENRRLNGESTSGKETKSLLGSKYSDTECNNSREKAEGKAVQNLDSNHVELDYDFVASHEDQESDRCPCMSGSGSLPEGYRSSEISSSVSSGRVMGYVRVDLSGSGDSASNASQRAMISHTSQLVFSEASSHHTNYDYPDSGMLKLSMATTLPLREQMKPFSEISVYPAAQDAHVSPYDMPICGGRHSKGSFSKKSHKIQRPWRISDAGSRSVCPSVSQQPSLLSDGHVFHGLALSSQDLGKTSQHVNTDYVTTPPLAYSGNPFVSPAGMTGSSSSSNDFSHSSSGYSKMVEAPVNKRGSMPLENVLNFPPPPSSPPSSPDAEEIPHLLNHTAYPPPTLCSPKQPFSQPGYNVHSVDQTMHSAAAADGPSSCVPHVAISPDGERDALYHMPKSAMWRSEDSEPNSTDLTDSIRDSCPSNSNYLPNGASTAAAMLPRDDGHRLSVAGHLSRPLSGDLLALPEKYYLDPKLGGSNQILTEL